MRKILLVTFAALIGTSMAVQTNKLSLQKVSKALGYSQIDESTEEKPRHPRHFLDTDAPAREELAQYLFAESYQGSRRPSGSNGTSNGTGNSTTPPPQNGSAGGNGTQPRPSNGTTGGNGTNPPPQNGTAGGNGTQPPRNGSGGNGTQPPQNGTAGGNGTQPPRNGSGGNGTQPPQNGTAGGNGTQPPRNGSAGGNGTNPPPQNGTGGNGTQPPRNGSAGGNGTNPPPQNGTQGNGTQPPRNQSSGGNGTNPPPQNGSSGQRTSLIQSLLMKKSENKTSSGKKEGSSGKKKDCEKTDEETTEDGDVPPPPREEEQEEEEITIESLLAEVCKDADNLPDEFKTPDGKLNFNPAFGRTNWTDPIAKKKKSGNFSDFIKFFSNFTGQDFNTPFKSAKQFCELNGFAERLSEWVASQPEFDEEKNSYKGVTVRFEIDTYIRFAERLLPKPVEEEEEVQEQSE